jgi:hypothetical protein
VSIDPSGRNLTISQADPSPDMKPRHSQAEIDDLKK